MGADARVRGAWAGTEVEGGDGNAATVQTHHVWPTRSPVLHVTQIQAVIQHCMAASVGHTKAELHYSTSAGPQHLDQYSISQSVANIWRSTLLLRGFRYIWISSLYLKCSSKFGSFRSVLVLVS